MTYYRLDHIKKLERRIHNQRFALHDNWQIVDQRLKQRAHYTKPKWFEYVKKQNKEIKRLNNVISVYKFVSMILLAIVISKYIYWVIYGAWL